MMRFTKIAARLTLSMVGLLSASAPTYAQTGAESTLYSFPSTGSAPSPIIEASDGNFYGTVNTDSNGYAHGYVFRLTPGGVFSTLYVFQGLQDGANPSASLIEGNDGSLYGTNQGNGIDQGGVLFRLTLDGKYTVLHVLTASKDGSNPGSLIQNKAGEFFGVAQRGGSRGDGTLFEYQPDNQNSCSTGQVDSSCREGVFSVVHTFTDTPDGAFPIAPLLQASDGLIYGVTLSGGTPPIVPCYLPLPQCPKVGSDLGSLFLFNPAHPESFTTFASFPYSVNIGAGAPEVLGPPRPTFGLTEGSNKLLYGMTTTGGVGGLAFNTAGTIYSMELGKESSGTFQNAWSFSAGMNGGLPVSGLTLGGDGHLYGSTTYLGRWFQGTVFQYAPTEPALSTLYAFTYSGNSGAALGAPIEGSDANLYGVRGLNIYRLILTPAIPPPIGITAKASSITRGHSLTFAWKVNNAFSQTMQNCQAHGDWSGFQPLTGKKTFTPTKAGEYTYALTCGGVESANTTVVVK